MGSVPCITVAARAVSHYCRHSAKCLPRSTRKFGKAQFANKREANLCRKLIQSLHAGKTLHMQMVNPVMIDLIIVVYINVKFELMKNGFRVLISASGHQQVYFRYRSCLQA